MKNKIHFEIGTTRPDTDGETYSVFTSRSLRDTLAEFKAQGYTRPEYFIDIWEEDGTGLPIPLAEVHIEPYIFD